MWIERGFRDYRRFRFDFLFKPVGSESDWYRACLNSEYNAPYATYVMTLFIEDYFP